MNVISINSLLIRLDHGGQEDIRQRQIANSSGEENAHASTVNDQLREVKQENNEDAPLYIGDHVEDRDNPDTTMVVIDLGTLRADRYELGNGGPTVADVNPEYPETDVVEVVFPDRTDMDIDQKCYTHPKTCLERIASVHEIGGGK